MDAADLLLVFRMGVPLVLLGGQRARREQEEGNQSAEVNGDAAEEGIRHRTTSDGVSGDDERTVERMLPIDKRGGTEHAGAPQR